MERLQKQIEENQERSRTCREEKEKKDEALKTVLAGLQGLYLCINPLAISKSNALIVLNRIQTELEEILRKINDGEIPFDIEEKVKLISREINMMFIDIFVTIKTILNYLI